MVEIAEGTIGAWVGGVTGANLDVHASTTSTIFDATPICNATPFDA
eukprot:COSAG06_NODE_10292_length_1709_cov_2.639934_4_plen_45_part_01